ncbi:MAG TPA: tripartite tricarboxylate transporter substrate binding protein, partial [Saliniramus sp.]|nr:tripartite tricarboxylate transporter substrate binding protein [Saliniramus sp.]
VPQPVLDKLSGELVATLNEPDVAEAIEKLGFTMNVRAPEDFRPYHEQEIETWKAIIDAAGVEAQ